MEPAIDISVVIVNWNTRDLLLDCVESLFAETRESSLEIIVVDNASRDGSMEALAARFPQTVRIANTENAGFARANNQGLAVARGRYLCLVNSDVKALAGVLDRLRAFLESRPDVGAVAPRTVGRDLKLRRNCREFPSLRNEICQALFLDRLFPSRRFFRSRSMRDYDYASQSEIEALSGCFLMVPRSVQETVGGLDERFFIYAEDVDWCKRIREAGWRVIYFPEAEAIHYGGSSSATERVRFNLEILKAHLQYWRKHHGRLATALFWWIQLTGIALRAFGWSLKVSGDSRDRATEYWRAMGWVLRAGWRYVLA